MQPHLLFQLGHRVDFSVSKRPERNGNAIHDIYQELLRWAPLSGNSPVTFQPAAKKEGEDTVEEGQAEDATPSLARLVYGKNERTIARHFVRNQLQSGSSEVHPIVHFLNLAELFMNHLRQETRNFNASQDGKMFD